MWHPFLDLSSTMLVGLFLFAGLASAACFFWLLALDRRLRNRQAPYGTTSLQLANTAAASRQIVESWSLAEREMAERKLCIDYVFVPLYTTALAAASILAAHSFARNGWPTMAAAAVVMAWGHWGVALLDLAENSVLLRILQISPDVPDSLSVCASRCARIKMILVFLAVACCVFSLTGAISTTG